MFQYPQGNTCTELVYIYKFHILENRKNIRNIYREKYSIHCIPVFIYVCHNWIFANIDKIGTTNKMDNIKYKEQYIKSEK